MRDGLPFARPLPRRLKARQRPLRHRFTASLVLQRCRNQGVLPQFACALFAHFFQRMQRPKRACLFARDAFGDVTLPLTAAVCAALMIVAGVCLLSPVFVDAVAALAADHGQSLEGV